MLTSVEDAYTEYLQRLCVEDDVDQDVVRATLRRLGHSTPSVDSILGNGDGAGGGRHRRRAAANSSSTTSSSFYSVAALAPETADAMAMRDIEDDEAEVNSNRVAAGRPSSLPVQQQPCPVNSIPTTPEMDTPTIEDATAPRGEACQITSQLSAVQALLGRLQHELNKDSTKSRDTAAHLRTTATAAADRGTMHKDIHFSSASSDSTSEPATTISANNLSSSYYSSSGSWDVDQGCVTDSAREEARWRGSLRPCEYAVLQDLALREAQLREQQQERQRRKAQAQEARCARRAFIPHAPGLRRDAPASAGKYKKRSDFGDNAPASAGLRGRSISREPVGSCARRGRVIAAATRQQTSAAAPCTHSPAMRLPVAVGCGGGGLSSRGTAPLPSTLPRERHVDKVLCAQRYLQEWDRRERRAAQSKKKAMWATRCRLLGCEE